MVGKAWIRISHSGDENKITRSFRIQFAAKKEIIR